ncbi:MAG: hypothetical protein ACPGJV_13140 [Bacteriovoracaceae bacterium]
MSSRIIISIKEPILSDLILFSLQAEHFFEVIECSSGYVKRSIEAGAYEDPISVEKMPEDFDPDESIEEDYDIADLFEDLDLTDDIEEEDSEEDLLNDIEDIQSLTTLFEVEEEELFEEVAEKLSISEEVKTGIKASTKRTVDLVKKNKTLSKLFNKLLKSLNKQDDYLKHAHDLADYIIHNDDWTPQGYTILANRKFSGGTFRKIVNAVKELK